MYRFALAAAGLFAFTCPTQAGNVRYNRDVRPILAEACFNCHGPGKQKAGLRLDEAPFATKPNKKGRTAIVPDKPEQSEAIRRLFTTEETEVMPPPDSHKTLTPAQKAILKQWVAEGAVYEPHWSFASLKRPPVPTVTGPNIRNPIDAFLIERLARAKQTPNPEADRPTLIRRVSFALTGLPPTPQAVDTYLADRSPDAYEKMVERYLAAPQFGEEMARHWLDLARYADTHGLHLDNVRSMWPYRDWVVRAFNTNKPFDQFTVEQLAGDLLPNPTKEQLVATGFNRCNISTGEGGSIASEWYFRNAVDRATVAAETWLGLTAGCVVCHDHKFDPISQKDFYAFYAFFYSADGPPLDGNALLHEPSVRLPSPEQERQLAELDRRIADLNAAVKREQTGLKHADPIDAAPIVGAVVFATAKPEVSFQAWIASGGGKDASKLPRDLANTLRALNQPKTPRPNTAQVAKLREHYLTHVCTATKGRLEKVVKARDAAVAERTKLDQAIPGSMIFRDAPTPRPAFVMLRGQYDKPGDPVEPNTPAALPPMKRAKPATRATRLDLARWVVAPENPLTARVYVNRLWQQFFGTGLSKTVNDFGVQGEPPTHPELLDWLAADFRDGGWNVKATVRKLVTSAAFRRASTVRPELFQADPENRLYARGPRFRLDAEQVRDNALAVGGLLNPQLGGPGVKPYQPDNIWEPVAYTGSNTRNYKRDDGPALYRRSLYTFFKRTAPPPFLSNFDAPNREQPCGQRDRSNTPLQSLQLMNDVQQVEAARAFAERIITEGGPTAESRIVFAFKVTLSRLPSTEEQAILAEQLRTHLTRYAAAPEDAKKLIAHGETKPRAGLKPDEVAAYTLLASTLLNLDETLTRN